MSRPLRIEYPGAWYHVMNRGRRSESIFSDKHDYLKFIDLLIEISGMWNVNVAAYCLMTNHYHILLQTPDANISRCMRSWALKISDPLMPTISDPVYAQG